jgi:hypothetical protein
MGFKIGQLWKDNLGSSWRILDIKNNKVKKHPIIAYSHYEVKEFSTKGKTRGDKLSLTKLVEDVTPRYSKKELNFWEARKMALCGFRVRIVDRIGDMDRYYFHIDNFQFTNRHFDSKWEIVEDKS